MVDLYGARVLVVEDEYFIASDLARALDAAGAKAVGPTGSLEKARALVRSERIDAAVLDLNLRGEMAYQLVTELSESGLPCVIMSGYGPESLPASVRHVPSVEKPVDYDRVVQALASQLATRQSRA